MLHWITSNLATILVLAVVALLVLLVTVRVIKDKKEGKTSCGHNCQGCAMHGSCHKQ